MEQSQYNTLCKYQKHCHLNLPLRVKPRNDNIKMYSTEIWCASAKLLHLVQDNDIDFWRKCFPCSDWQACPSTSSSVYNSFSFTFLQLVCKFREQDRSPTRDIFQAAIKCFLFIAKPQICQFYSQWNWITFHFEMFTTPIKVGQLSNLVKCSFYILHGLRQTDFPPQNDPNFISLLEQFGNILTNVGHCGLR